MIFYILFGVEVGRRDHYKRLRSSFLRRIIICKVGIIRCTKVSTRRKKCLFVRCHIRERTFLLILAESPHDKTGAFDRLLLQGAIRCRNQRCLDFPHHIYLPLYLWGHAPSKRRISPVSSSPHFPSQIHRCFANDLLCVAVSD